MSEDSDKFKPDFPDCDECEKEVWERCGHHSTTRKEIADVKARQAAFEIESNNRFDKIEQKQTSAELLSEINRKLDELLTRGK
jgi:hypothetical protein